MSNEPLSNKSFTSSQDHEFIPTRMKTINASKPVVNPQQFTRVSSNPLLVSAQKQMLQVEEIRKAKEAAAVRNRRQISPSMNRLIGFAEASERGGAPTARLAERSELLEEQEEEAERGDAHEGGRDDHDDGGCKHRAEKNVSRERKGRCFWASRRRFPSKKNAGKIDRIRLGSSYLPDWRSRMEREDRYLYVKKRTFPYLAWVARAHRLHQPSVLRVGLLG